MNQGNVSYCSSYCSVFCSKSLVSHFADQIDICCSQGKKSSPDVMWEGEDGVENLNKQTKYLSVVSKLLLLTHALL